MQPLKLREYNIPGAYYWTRYEIDVYLHMFIRDHKDLIREKLSYNEEGAHVYSVYMEDILDQFIPEYIGSFMYDEHMFIENQIAAIINESYFGDIMVEWYADEIEFNEQWREYYIDVLEFQRATR